MDTLITFDQELKKVGIFKLKNLFSTFFRTHLREFTHILGNFASFICFLSHCGHFEPILDLLGHSCQKLIAFKYGICRKTIFGIFAQILLKKIESIFQLKKYIFFEKI